MKISGYVIAEDVRNAQIYTEAGIYVGCFEFVVIAILASCENLLLHGILLFLMCICCSLLRWYGECRFTMEDIGIRIDSRNPKYRKVLRWEEITAVREIPVRLWGEEVGDESHSLQKI